MIEELHLSPPAPTLKSGELPLTPDEVKQRYGIDVFAEFPVVIIVDTAVEGPTAQKVSVYNQSQLWATYLTSTGREQWEEPPSGKKYFSSTPVGWYTAQHFVIDHHSSIWDAPMEFAIFFNGGIALHATTPDFYDKLGTRASGGCVRLKREDAEALWNLTYNLPLKDVPVFDVQGNMETDPQGQVIRKLGRGILILVVNETPPADAKN
jgi:hypothetical protein